MSFTPTVRKYKVIEIISERPILESLVFEDPNGLNRLNEILGSYIYVDFFSTSPPVDLSHYSSDLCRFPSTTLDSLRSFHVKN